MDAREVVGLEFGAHYLCMGEDQNGNVSEVIVGRMADENVVHLGLRNECFC